MFLTTKRILVGLWVGCLKNHILKSKRSQRSRGSFLCLMFHTFHRPNMVNEVTINECMYLHIFPRDFRVQDMYMEGKLKISVRLRYLQVRCRLWKIWCNFIKFVAYWGALHCHMKLFKNTCTIPCFWAQNFGLKAASFSFSITSLAIQTLL